MDINIQINIKLLYIYKFKYFLKYMYKPETLTIKELPKRKKMTIDEKNPIRKIR